jgi:hypothetical protein
MEVTFKSKATVDEKASALLEDPVAFFEDSYEAAHSLPREEMEAIQFAAMQQRFASLRDRVPVLKKLADEQDIGELKALDDVVTLLFGHTVYKSYPSSFIEKGQFGNLTKWLNKLTTLDLSNVDVSGCTGIDSWIKALDQQTDLRIAISSGTTGTVSVLPRTWQELRKQCLILYNSQFRHVGMEPPTDGHPLNMHVISLGYRRGPRGILRSNDYKVEFIAGAEERMHVLMPGEQSADLLYLGGKLKSAAAKGRMDAIKIDPALLARKAEFEQHQKDAEQNIGAFFETVLEEQRGKRIYMAATNSQQWEFARTGLEKGLEGVFAPNSLVIAGGGNKGQTLPDDWEEQAKRFLGVREFLYLYGMSEVSGAHLMCRNRRYHIDPTAILYILDPDTGAPLPRSGVQTGRSAFFDLQPYTNWGGFISGDEVTVDWSEPCGCGRKSPHLSSNIDRYSVLRGGDDKISCAAAPEAHDSAMTYLNEMVG